MPGFRPLVTAEPESKVLLLQKSSHEGFKY